MKLHPTIDRAIDTAYFTDTYEDWDVAVDLITGAKCGLQMRGGKKSQKLINELHEVWLICIARRKKVLRVGAK